MTFHKSFLNIFVIALLAAICTGGWAYFNRPIEVPDWPEEISGFSYSPFRSGQSPVDNTFPTDDQIREDLTTLAGFTDNIRIYAISGNMQRILPIAEEVGLTVTLGIWLSKNKEANTLEINSALDVLETNRNIRAVFVGNESLYREDVRVDELIAYIDEVRSLTSVPVSTAEPWHIWIEYPELAKHVDVIAAHVLPFWQEEISDEQAIPFVLATAKRLRQEFGKKPLILAEVGWPSHGRALNGSDSSRIKQAVFLRTLMNELNTKGYKYFVIEAFDQPWKVSDEGDVGAYWGIFDVDRMAKFPLTGTVIKIPKWRALAAASVILGIFALTIILIDSSGLHQRGRVFLASLAFIFASFLVFVGYGYSQQYLSWFEWMMGGFLVLGASGVFIVLFTEAHELAESVWVQVRRRAFKPVTTEVAYRPKVSIHIPCYNEPPEMVKQTLDALAVLDYPDYEVLVIDNNTKNEEVWKPLEAYCKELGSKFHFYHVSPLEGYKAGALNYILEKTAKDAEVIAVIDCDYCVDPHWLKHLVPHFENPDIAIVQNPQDYRDQDESFFKKLCYAEYKGFFHIGMITRNDRDAIIQHGTMTMIRRSVMKELGWAQWCITEDAELGLRVFEKGLSAAYISDSYGKGLMPDRFIDFKKQRFRWAYGAMQILKTHAGSLFFGKNTQLTRGQRYHFVAGWLPWLADGLNLFFTGGALLWSAAMLIAPDRFFAPALIFAAPPLLLFAFKIAKILYLYKRSLKVKFSTAFGAAIAGLSLSHTIAKAVIYGLVTNHMPFFRTPKKHQKNSFWDATVEAREELFFLILLLSTILALIYIYPTDTVDAVAWLLMLFVQSLSYMSALFMAWISSSSAARQD
jgi:exo-beta-1,3-glucanase (GH17 family)/cellulose synthase/poly-beta-1,6-N-acetylglucosamine synthase-like glycosyltransferase